MQTSQTKFFGTYSVQQQGIRGKVVTLPAKWCDMYGIKPGTPLDIYIVEGEKPYIILEPKTNGGK